MYKDPDQPAQSLHVKRSALLIKVVLNLKISVNNENCFRNTITGCLISTKITCQDSFNVVKKMSVSIKLLMLSIGPDRQNFQLKIVIIFLSINLKICFGCSKEPS